MKLLVFSDIHGNSYSLKAIEHILANEEFDHVFFLGDIFGYYYGQPEILDFLINSNIQSVMGNHDFFALECLKGNLDPYLLSEKYGKSYLELFNLTQTQIDWLSSLPLKIYQEFDGKRYCFVHGTFNDPLFGRIYENDSIELELGNWDVLLCGHTHHGFLKSFEKKIWLNVGSIGQPRNGMYPTLVSIDTNNNIYKFLTAPHYKQKLKFDLKRNGDLELDHCLSLNRFLD